MAAGGAGTWGFGLLDPQPVVKVATKTSPAAATVGSHARLTMRGSLRKPYVLLGLEGYHSPAGPVNPNPNLVNRKRENTRELAGPVRCDEEVVRLAKVPRSGRHDGPLADDQLATLA